MKYLVCRMDGVRPHNRTVVLRKSVGPFSAGTVVGSYNSVNGWMATFSPEGYSVSTDMVTKLRSRSDLVPTNNRAKRRAHKTAEYKLLKDLGAI